MNERERLSKQLEEAEQELDAAKALPALNAAAKKLQRARAELKALDEAEKPMGRPVRPLRTQTASATNTMMTASAMPPKMMRVVQRVSSSKSVGSCLSQRGNATVSR
jgi:hypothetical protein